MNTTANAYLNEFFKRAFDVFASFFGLLILSPVFVFIAVLIKRESPGPVFYGGKRAGRNNQPFQIWKFRTMYETPQSYAGSAVTAKDDRRITPLGHWLRDTKLNELPQLWNVLVGEMSLVGPRPEDWNIAQEADAEARAEILSVRPGITSPASVIYRDEEKILQGEDFMNTYYHHILPDKMRLDRLYVRYHSLLSDIDIILWTLAVLLPRIAATRIGEGNIFGGPISRFVRFNVSWFTADFIVAFLAVSVIGVIWRTTGPIDLGAPKALLFALVFALLFGTFNTFFGLNSVVWSRAVPEDMFGIFISSGIVIALASSVNLVTSSIELPTPMLMMMGVGATLGFIAIRYRWRLLAGLTTFRGLRKNSLSVGERVLIIGTGEEGEFINWLLRRSLLRYAFSIIGVVDDDPRKQGMRLDGNWVIGTLADIPHLVKEHDVGLIMLAVSGNKKTEHEKALDACIETNARLLLISDLMRATQFWLDKAAPHTPPDVLFEQARKNITE
ncbi:MAG: hypothetical protein Fur002_05500 [Anaerolineales bacterium]